MSYFDEIYPGRCLPDGCQKRIRIGHVAPDGIYLSFKHFEYGYSPEKQARQCQRGRSRNGSCPALQQLFAQYGASDTHFRQLRAFFQQHRTHPTMCDLPTGEHLRSYAFQQPARIWAVRWRRFLKIPKG